MTDSNERIRRSEEILFRVSSLPEGRRRAAAARLCGRDASLEAEVRSLLDHESEVDGFLEEPALGMGFHVLPASGRDPPANEDVDDDRIGRTVGRYRIESRIASGGMGTVYLASRADDAFTQRVAVKIVKRGMDTDDVLERFRRERQTLARLEHPNIARLLDGGATEDGRPFLVLEYVEGEPIDEYCDRRRLGLEERIELFLVVCDAVRHAHQHLVLHRDLKPGNILVTADGRPKLLDFGISTLLEDRDARCRTRSRDRRLTPEYASPEHISGSPLSTASDVYSLGVILYELLSGRPPHRFPTRTPAEIRRIVSEEEPPPPSQAVVEAGSSSTRGATASTLARALRGDLDTISLAALRKEPSRRYPSVEAFTADLRRFLGRLPISARRDTLAYRTSRFVRRHSVGTSFGALSVALLVSGAAAFAGQASLARRERDRAVALRARAEAITNFLTGMLEAADPARSGPDVTVREVLEDASRRLDRELAGEPLVQATVRGTIGRTYHSLGLYAEAEPRLREALRQRRELLGDGHVDTAEARCDLATVLYSTNELDEAASELEAAVAAFRAANGSGKSLASALSSLGAVRRARGELDLAETLQRESLDLRRRLAGGEDLAVAESSNNLASVLASEGRLEEARSLAEDALAIRRRELGDFHPLVAQSTDNLAVLFHRSGDLEHAEPLYRKALELETRLLGPDHPDVAVTRRSLGILLAGRGALAEAEAELRACLVIRERTLPRGDVRILTTTFDLADVLVAENLGVAADPMVESALEATCDLDEANPVRRTTLRRAADHFRKRGAADRAAELLAGISEAVPSAEGRH